LIHDAEWGLIDKQINRLGPWPAGSTFDQSNPQWLHQQLMHNDAYRFRFQERAHRHLTGDGALTPAASLARLTARKEQLEQAVIAESARWGDTWRDQPYTKADWLKAVAKMTDEILPQRTAIVLDQLRDARIDGINGPVRPLYPTIDAPVISPSGGVVPQGFEVTLQGTSAIYYTVDGSDPRAHAATFATQAFVASGATARIFVPTDGSIDDVWTATDFDDSQWMAGPTGVGYSAPTAAIADLIQTNIGDQMVGRASSAYVRIPFTIEQPQALDQLTLRVRYNNGFVAYLNGEEIARAGVPQSVDWDSRASGLDSTGRLFDEFPLAPFRDRVRPGPNVLAIHGLNRSKLNDRDFLIDVELIGYVATDRGAAAAALTYERPITIDRDTVVQARAWSHGEWSRLAVAQFQVVPPVAGDANLDGRFDSADLLLVFQAGEYEDAVEDNSSFAEGDWNQDGDFTSSDLVWAFQTSRYIVEEG
jgi:hypothetical protein